MKVTDKKFLNVHQTISPLSVATTVTATSTKGESSPSSKAEKILVSPTTSSTENTIRTWSAVCFENNTVSNKHRLLRWQQERMTFMKHFPSFYGSQKLCKSERFWQQIIDDDGWTWISPDFEISMHLQQVFPSLFECRVALMISLVFLSKSLSKAHIQFFHLSFLMEVRFLWLPKSSAKLST